jgi:hypothetical protein
MKILVEPFMNACVQGLGGELVEYLMPAVNPPEQADYLFREVDIVGELKCLENDLFSENHRKKLARLALNWIRQGLIRAAEIVTLDLQLLPEECQREWIALMKRHIQQVIKDANRQIRETKRVLDLRTAKGVLFLANEAISLPPQELMNLVHRVLSSRKADKTPMFSNIDWIVLFTVNRPAWLKAEKRQAHYWMQVHREVPDSNVEEFLSNLRQSCFANLGELTGLLVEEKHLGKSDLDALTICRNEI